MVSAGNEMSGRDSQRAIFESSLFLQHFMKPNSQGRKSLLTCEFMDWSKENLTGLTLVDKSQFFILPVTLPEIYMLSEDDHLRRAMKGYMMYITQTARSVDGISDISIDVQTPTFKTPFFNLPLFTNIQNPTTEITLSVPADTTGYFIVNQTRHWLNAISDEFTRAAHYNGLNIDYNNWSHSATMAYIKPNKTYTKLDYGALWFMMIPKGAQTSNFNADATSPGVADVSITFNVNVIDNRNIKCKELLESFLAKYRAYMVMDSTLFGVINNTYFSTLEDINADTVFDQTTNLS